MRKILLSVGALVLPLLSSPTRFEVASQVPPIEQPGSIRNSNQKQSATVVTVSPKGIEKYLNGSKTASLREVWRNLGMRYAPTDMSYDCGGGCEAISFPVGLDDGARELSIVKIAWEGGGFYQYLVFSGSEEAWRFVGHIESVEQRYGSPTHRVEEGDGRVWLVITELQGSGSGVVLYGDEWYELGKERLRCVLSCPSSGQSIPRGDRVAREFQTKVMRHGIIDGTYTVEVEFSVKYGVGELEDLPLFSKTQKGRYVWRPDRRNFVLDEATSELSRKEIEAVYNIDSLNNEEFLQYNFPELRQMAGKGNAEQKRWLGGFLIGLRNSERRQALEKTLAK